jgi:hypothetical protein
VLPCRQHHMGLSMFGFHDICHCQYLCVRARSIRVVPPRLLSEAAVLQSLDTASNTVGATRGAFPHYFQCAMYQLCVHASDRSSRRCLYRQVVLKVSLHCRSDLILRVATPLYGGLRIAGDKRIPSVLIICDGVALPWVVMVIVMRVILISWFTATLLRSVPI